MPSLVSSVFDCRSRGCKFDSQWYKVQQLVFKCPKLQWPSPCLLRIADWTSWALGNQVIVMDPYPIYSYKNEKKIISFLLKLPASILLKSILNPYRLNCIAFGPITVWYRFKQNVSWEPSSIAVRLTTVWYGFMQNASWTASTICCFLIL